jgi:predicted  nucleic acid-binding Zn-ribbon protein
MAKKTAAKPKAKAAAKPKAKAPAKPKAKAPVKAKAKTPAKTKAAPAARKGSAPKKASKKVTPKSQPKPVAISKLAKAKIKPKEKVFVPRKIEKLIDVTELENKLKAISGLNHQEFSVEEKLKALYILQQIDSNVDKIRTIRGELPMEVTDLEDEVAGLETRIVHINEEIAQVEDMISRKKQSAKDAKDSIKKYEAQQMKVKNNREYDSLTKEIEFQNLEIQLSDKRIKEYSADIIAKNALLESAQEVLKEKEAILKLKKAELDAIIEETKKEEQALQKISDEASTIVDERLLAAYKRVRTNAANGLGVVAVQRDACGGCFNKIPPQRQLDIRQHKKVIVCEHCGRILVDPAIEAI